MESMCNDESDLTYTHKGGKNLKVQTFKSRVTDAPIDIDAIPSLN